MEKDILDVICKDYCKRFALCAHTTFILNAMKKFHDDLDVDFKKVLLTWIEFTYVKRCRNGIND